jgi:hypothetical protein
MTGQISEADWKEFRRLRPVALERFCQGVLAEVGRLSTEPGKSNHERYLAVYRLLQRQDRELAATFDSPRRSAAWLQLASMRARGLLTEEELSRFSEEARAVVRRHLGDVQAE